MTRKEYNGWTNYETWNCALWMDNDGACEMFRGRAEEMADKEKDENGEIENKDDLINQLAEEIKEYIEENNPMGDNASMYSDMLGAALQEIDYYEIASHYFED